MFKNDEPLKLHYKKNLTFFNPKDFYLEPGKNEKDFFKQKIDKINIFIKIENNIIIRLWHDSKSDSDLKMLINLFFEIILNKNIQEAADHGIIYLEDKLRLKNTKNYHEVMLIMFF